MTSPHTHSPAPTGDTVDGNTGVATARNGSYTVAHMNRVTVRSTSVTLPPCDLDIPPPVPEVTRASPVITHDSTRDERAGYERTGTFAEQPPADFVIKASGITARGTW